MPWKKYLSPKGKEYYHNSDTNVTTWKQPIDYVESATKPSSGSSNNNNNSGKTNLYVKVTNAKGKTYYYNQATNETCWVIPEGGKVITRRHSALMQLAEGKGPAGTNTSPVKKAALAVYENEMRQATRSPNAPSTSLKPKLPSDWQAVVDQKTGKTYYWNQITGKTSWTVPGGLSPPKKILSGGNSNSTSSSGRSGKVKKGRRGKNVVGESVGDDEYVRENIRKSQAVQNIIKKALKSNFVFDKLPESTHKDFIDVMAPVKHSAGHVIIQEGEMGDNFFVLESGTCDVLIQGKKVASLRAGQSFGEKGMYFNDPRNATIKAATACNLWTINRTTFLHIAHAAMNQNVDVASENLEKIEWLKGLGEEEITKVAGACSSEEAPAGSIIVKKGEKGDKFYIIKSGTVKCYVSENDANPLYLGKGKFFGELALLKDQPRAATVEAVKDVQLLTLNRQAFQVLLGPIHARLKVSYETGNMKAQRQSIDQRHTEEMNRQSKLKRREQEKMNSNNIEMKELQKKKVLGEGTFGRVELVYHQRTQTSWALKTQMKAQIVEAKQQKACMLEKKVMASLRHPFILRLEATYQDTHLLYMLLECVPGGELFQLLAQKRTGTVPSDHARFYGACVVDAFSYMHDNKIVYRDLKPENLLIDREGYIKVIDFGFAKFLDVKPYRTMTFCGTPEYFAPEIMLGKGYDFSVDTWGIGILIYEMIYGYTPFADFEANNPHTTMKYIMKNKVDFPTDGNPDRVVKKLIKCLLAKKVVQRLGCGLNGTKDVKTHEWFNSKEFNWERLENKEMKAPWVPKLKGDHDVVEPMEEYSNEYRPRKYRGDQDWCKKW